LGIKKLPSLKLSPISFFDHLPFLKKNMKNEIDGYMEKNPLFFSLPLPPKKDRPRKSGVIIPP